mmetsp:Transcript_88165/g.251682  ORF Transcript_88165/g.251682 Transcript_88165/m.251682 type:complete len:825 (+) Transcript_88165:1067-3541(+)
MPQYTGTHMGPYDVVTFNTGTLKCEFVMVNLKPDTLYRYKITALTFHNEKYKMISGSTIESSPVRTKGCRWLFAWYFESEDDFLKEWRVFFGSPMDEPMERDERGNIIVESKFADMDHSRLSQLVLTKADEEYFLGKSSLKLPFNGQYGGGCYVDIMNNDSREYEIKCMVKHSAEPKGGTTLRVWDYDDDWEVSEPALEMGTWEELRVVMSGSKKYRSRVHIQVQEGYEGDVFIDCVEITVLGRNKLAQAANRLEEAAKHDIIDDVPSVDLDVIGAHNLPLLHNGKPCNPYVEVLLNDEVVGTSEQLKKTFDPVWNYHVKLSFLEKGPMSEVQIRVLQDDGELVGETHVEGHVLLRPPSNILWLGIERAEDEDKEEDAVVGVLFRPHEPAEHDGEVAEGVAEMIESRTAQNRIAAFDSMCRLADDEDKDIIEILDRRVEFIHMGAIREAVTAIAMGEEKILEGAMKMITEFLHFPQNHVNASADVAAARGSLQQYCFAIGVINPLEEFLESDTNSHHLTKLRVQSKEALRLLHSLTYGNRKDLLAILISRHSFFRLIMAFLETEPEAQYMLKMLNCYQELPQPIIELYEEFRFDIPIEVPGYWRCASLLELGIVVNEAVKDDWHHRTLEREEAAANKVPRPLKLLRIQVPGEDHHGPPTDWHLGVLMRLEDVEEMREKEKEEKKKHSALHLPGAHHGSPKHGKSPKKAGAHASPKHGFHMPHLPGHHGDGKKQRKKKDGGAAIIGMVPKKDPAKEKVQGKRQYMMLPLDPEHWEQQHAALHDHSHDHHFGENTPKAITSGAAAEEDEEEGRVVVRQDVVAGAVL